MVAISTEIQAMLRKNGLRIIHTKPAKPAPAPPLHKEGNCSRCNGLNFYIMNVPHGHDMFGKSIPCDCVKINRSSQYMICSGLTELETKYTLNFDKTTNRFPKAVQAAWKIVETRKSMVILFGSNGTGKSGLLMATVATACRNGTEAHYTTATRMMDDIKSTFDSRNNPTDTTEQRKMRYINMPILVIDEVEDVNLTKYTAEVFKRIVDERYRHRHDRATCFATNLIPKKMDGRYRFLGQVNEALGDIDDRLKDARRLPMIGETLRGKKR